MAVHIQVHATQVRHVMKIMLLAVLHPNTTAEALAESGMQAPEQATGYMTRALATKGSQAATVRATTDKTSGLQAISAAQVLMNISAARTHQAISAVRVHQTTRAAPTAQATHAAQALHIQARVHHIRVADPVEVQAAVQAEEGVVINIRRI